MELHDESEAPENLINDSRQNIDESDLELKTEKANRASKMR